MSVLMAAAGTLLRTRSIMAASSGKTDYFFAGRYFTTDLGLEDYISHFGKSFYASLARERIDELRKSQKVQMCHLFRRHQSTSLGVRQVARYCTESDRSMRRPLGKTH